MVETVIVETVPAFLMEEAVKHGRDTLQEWIAKSGGPRPDKVIVTYDTASEEFVCEVESKKPNIVRKRRITGYLSDYNNFNPSKRAEAKDRIHHMKFGEQ